MRHERPNILLVGNWRSDAGYAWKMIERFWIAIARAFPGRRTVLCFPQVTTFNPEITGAGIEVREFDFNFRRPAALARFCRQNDIGLVYLSDRPYSSGMYPLLKSIGVVKIVVHDHTPGQRTRPSPLKRLAKATRIRMSGADAYIACSTHVLERLTKVACIPPERCYLAQNGIDVARFSHPHSKIRQELALSAETLLAVSCSRVHPYKRITDIVDAAALVPDLDLHFIHIGDGPDFDTLKSRIRDHGLSGRFTLLGRRDDVPEILSDCDIAIHASNGEVGLSLSILEFMASRLAVLVTDEPTVSKIIDPRRTGLTFPHGNTAVLADQLRRLGTDPHLRDSLGRAARKEIEANYRIEDTVSSLISALKQVYPG